MEERHLVQLVIFLLLLRPMLLTNSASQHWAPSAGLSPCQRLKATQGPCPAIVPVPQRKRAHAVLCCGVWSQEWALPHHPVDVPRVSVTPLWTHAWQIINTLLSTTLICPSVMRTGICYTSSFPECRIFWISGTVGTSQLIPSPVLSVPKAAFTPPSLYKATPSPVVFIVLFTEHTLASLCFTCLLCSLLQGSAFESNPHFLKETVSVEMNRCLYPAVFLSSSDCLIHHHQILLSVF